VDFSSSPSGATIVVGSSTCVTPCQLDVPVHTSKIEAISSAGEKKAIDIGYLTAADAEARYRLSKAGEGGLVALSAPFLIVGLPCLLIADFYNSGKIRTDNSMRDRDAFLLVGMASSLIGASLLGASTMVADNAREVKPVVRISFEQLQPVIPPVNIGLHPHPAGSLNLFPDKLPEAGNPLK
jgi:hypothetical protein